MLERDIVLNLQVCLLHCTISLKNACSQRKSSAVFIFVDISSTSSYLAASQLTQQGACEHYRHGANYGAQCKEKSGINGDRISQF